MHAYLNKKEESGLISDIVGTVINKSIDVLHLEIHLPGYQDSWPDTKLAQCP